MAALSSTHGTGEQLCQRCAAFFTNPLPKELEEGDRLTKEFGLHETFDEFRSAALVQKCWICWHTWINTGAGEEDSSLYEKFYMTFTFRDWKSFGRLRRLVQVTVRWGSHALLNFCDYIITPTDSSLGNGTPETKTLQTNTGSEQSLDLMKRWVSDCVLGHENCGKGRTERSYSPSRLIHFSMIEDYWQLHVAQEDGIPSSTDYVCLSYRWGHHDQLTLNALTIKQFRQGLSISALPKTFQDAIRIARLLSVEYLWIDSLCIMQDSKEDWEVESTRMRAIYANSYCTVAASWAPDPTSGLFKERDHGEIKCGYNTTNWTSEKFGPLGEVRIFGFNEWENQLLRSPLHKRGWTLQERILPPRVIYFTERQILWECDTWRRCEVFECEAPFEYTQPFLHGGRLYSQAHHREASAQHTSMPSKVMTPGLFARWIRVVEDYSKCSLTVAADKLVALDGLVELYQDLSGDEYLAGLWRSHIFESLVWERQYVNDPYRRSISKPVHYRAPSWSWAALDVPVVYNLNLAWTKLYKPFSMQHIEVITKPGSSSRGQVLSAEVILDGYGLLYELEKDRISPGNIVISDSDLEICIWFDCKQDGTLPYEGRPIYLLLLIIGSRLDDQYGPFGVRDGNGIVIQEANSPPEEYVRLGSFKTENWTAEHLDNFGLSVTEDGAILKKPDLEQRSFKII
jgi:hypothetical protein